MRNINKIIDIVLPSGEPANENITYFDLETEENEKIVAFLTEQLAEATEAFVAQKVEDLAGEFLDIFDNDDMFQFRELYQERGEKAVVEAMAQEIKERSED